MQIPTVQPMSPDQDVRLMEAASNGNLEQVKKFIRSGTNINAQDAQGITALIFAAMAGNLDVVKVLIASGADTQVKDKLGYDAYNAAMFFGDFRGATIEPFDKIMTALKSGARNA